MSTVVTKWSSPSLRRSRDLRWVGVLGAGALLGFALLRGGGKVEAVGEHATCDGVRDCRKLLSQAELQLDTCVLSCRDEQTHYLAARDLFRGSLEQAAEEEHKAELHQLQERQQLERAKADTAREQQRLLEARERDAVHQRQLELLEAQTKQRALALEAEHTEKIRYLSRLTLEQRKQRITACHERVGGCEELAELLVESSARPSERRALIDLHERLETGRAPIERHVTAPTTAPEKASAVPVVAPSPAAPPASCESGQVSADGVCRGEGEKVAIVTPEG